MISVYDVIVMSLYVLLLNVEILNLQQHAVIKVLFTDSG